TVITTVSLLPKSTTNLTAKTCDPVAAGVFTQHLTNQFGCDSTVITTVSLLPKSTTNLTAQTCDPVAAGVFTQNLTNQFGCDSTVITTVTLLPKSTTNLTAQTCDPTAAGVFTQHLINHFGCDSTVITTVTVVSKNTTNLTSQTCDPTAAGVFTQHLTNQFGCDSTVITTVSLLPKNTTNLTSQTCDPTAAGVFTQHLTNQFGCDSTVITIITLLPKNTTNLTAQTCDPTAAGVFTQHLTNHFGCDSNVVTTVTLLHAPTVMALAHNFNGFGVPCAGGHEGSVMAMASGGAPPFQFLWSNAATSPNIEHLSAGIYSVTCVDANGCSASSVLSLMPPPPLQIGFEVNHIDCFGHNEGIISAKPLGGAMPISFSMNSGPFQHSGSFTGLPSGQYTVTARDANGCTTSEIVVVNGLLQVNVHLGNDLTVELGDSVTLQALVNVPLDSIASVVWSTTGPSCPSCLSQQVIPFVTSTYTVGVTTTGGCHDEDTQKIKVNQSKHVYIPNVFSPNSDGQNDVFLIFAKEHTVKKIHKFLGFTRWGEQIWEFHDFQPNDRNFGWDGSFRGQKMDPAVFVWYAEVEFIDGTIDLLKGDVTLVR
ncbi:MAG: gliding motility-associated C-terminal domain-containing protein, partial [Bacteroidota bacterium]